MSVLGKFSVIMADPPWDIHMELPYGTMADEEMRRLAIPSLQDDGYIFLWVKFTKKPIFFFIWFIILGYRSCDGTWYGKFSFHFHVTLFFSL